MAEENRVCVYCLNTQVSIAHRTYILPVQLIITMNTRFSPVCRGPLVRAFTTLAVCFYGMLTGCHAVDFYTPSHQKTVMPEMELPRELSMVSLPAHRIEPPDIVQIEVQKLVPHSPYRIDTYDVLQINALGTLPNEPIYDYFLVDGEGMVNLGPAYGSVRVEGMSFEEATAEIMRHLQTIVQEPIVSVQLARSERAQQIANTYQIQPDGMINLSNFGMVHIAGKTVTEAKVAVEKHLSQYFDTPSVAVEVVQYNSKNYYVVIAGAENGESIQRFPISGNETVLDAISQIQGLSQVSSKTMWVSRPTPGDMETDQILPVDWVAIARGGVTDTNYQLLPGDRIYIVDDKLVATNNYITQMVAPIERLLNITSLGANTMRNTQTLGRAYNSRRSSN
jgi:polysaccharide biosynthesis/export protein